MFQFGPSTQQKREGEALKAVGDGRPYQWLYQNVYPGLRHTDYRIEYVVEPFSLEIARDLLYVHPEALSAEELYRVAFSYGEGSEEYYDALVKAADLYPDNAAAKLNAAVASIRKRRLKDADHYIQRAGSTPEADYVRLVLKAMNGTIRWKLQQGRVMSDD